MAPLVGVGEQAGWGTGRLEEEAESQVGFAGCLGLRFVRDKTKMTGKV